MKFKKITHRGQVMVMYALLIPLLFLFVGVGLDLGWYYLNVSRLQNAADAAVVAGAHALINDTENFSDYSYDGTIISIDETADTTASEKSTSAGDEVASEYALKNLSDDASAQQNEATYTMTDNWSKDQSSTVTLTPSLREDTDGNLYYVVRIAEQVRHLFMPGRFEDMNAPVVAVAMLSKNSNAPPVIPRDPGNGPEQEIPDGTDILTEMYKIEDVSVTRNWEWQDYYKNHKNQYKALTGKDVYSGNWNEYQDKGGVHYTTGKKYRTETATVYAGSPNQGSSTGKVANYAENEIDSLNLDFKADITFSKEWKDVEWEDFDIVYEGTAGFGYSNGAKAASANLRIHSTFTFTTPYAVRTGRSEEQIESNPEDALYVRIESEPIDPLSFKSSHRAYSSVRQIFININESNLDPSTRPLMFFYDGPEQIVANSTVRDSQPLILTLNADARAILFAPNSPVVIRGNGHQLHGFVIAREYHRLKTADDYYQEGGKYYDSSAKKKEYFYIAEEDTFVDEVGNVQTIKLNLDDERYTRAPIYTDDLEKPLRTDKILDTNYERVFKMGTFNLKKTVEEPAQNNWNTTRYDSFQLPSLKRNVYKYLDSYYDKDDEEKEPYNAVDMFFTKYRASWID